MFDGCFELFDTRETYRADSGRWLFLVVVRTDIKCIDVFWSVWLLDVNPKRYPRERSPLEVVSSSDFWDHHTPPRTRTSQQKKHCLRIRSLIRSMRIKFVFQITSHLFLSLDCWYLDICFGNVQYVPVLRMMPVCSEGAFVFRVCEKG